MRHTTFRQLEVFEAIARLGSFSRAAEELFLTQPTVSMQIKKLSETVGLPLFEQIGKKMFLTEAGRELEKTCREIFTHLDHYQMKIANLKGLKQGTLKIAVVTTAEYFAPRLLGSFSQQFPGIDLSLKILNRERVLDRLADNLDDLYILGQPPEELDVTAEPFLENPLVVIAPVDHPLARKKKIPLARLAEQSLLVRESGSGTRAALERLFSEHKQKLKVIMELGSNEAIKQAIAGGLGISVLSRHTLEGTQSRLAILDVEGFPIVRHWYVAYPRGKELSVIAHEFLDYLKAAQKLPSYV